MTSRDDSTATVISAADLCSAVYPALLQHVAAGGLPLKRDGKSKKNSTAARVDAADDGNENSSPDDDTVPTAVSHPYVPSTAADKFSREYIPAFAECHTRPYVDVDAEKARILQYYTPLLFSHTGDAAAVANAGERARVSEFLDATMCLTTPDELHAVLGGDSSQLPPCPSYDALNALQFGSYKHAKRRIPLWAEIDRQRDGTLRCAYNNEVIETAECCRLQKADEEHLVPQSWHRGSKLHPGTDMHQIYIVTKSSNGTRGNYLFGCNSKDASPRSGAGGIVTEGRLPISSSAAGSGNNTEELSHKYKFFMPHQNIGAVCRSTLYILVTYRNTFHREYFPPAQIAFLVRNAVEQPITEWERHRNQELHRLQGNRNPFIDFPHWALQLDFTHAFQDFVGKANASPAAEPFATTRKPTFAREEDADGGNRRMHRGAGRRDRH